MDFCKKFTAVAELNVIENRILMRKAQNSLFQKSTIYVYQVRLHCQSILYKYAYKKISVNFNGS